MLSFLRRKEPVEELYTRAEVTRFLLDEMQEALYGYNADLAKDDIGYIAVGDSGSRGSVLSDHLRRQIVYESRIYAIRDALCKMITTLWQAFGVGNGVTWRAKQDSAANAIKQLWGHKSNKLLFSIPGQRELSKRFVTDGEVFLIGFPGAPTLWRYLDPLQIVQLLTDPEDEFSTSMYLREYTDRSGVVKKRIYKDIDNVDGVPGEDVEGKIYTMDDIDEKDAVVIHARVNGAVGRSEPVLTASLEWAKAHRNFMRARTAIIQSIAQVTKKEIIKGSPAQVDAAKAREDAAMATRRAITNRPPTARKRIENAASKEEIVPQETWAQSAQVDGNMLLMLLGGGSGVYPHYLGAGEAFRLATATAMEGPMLRTFQSFQAVIQDVFDQVNEFELVSNGHIVEDIHDVVQVDMPEIHPQDLTATVEAITKMVTTFGKMKQLPDVQKKALSTIGMKDVDVLAKELEKIPDPAAAVAQPEDTDGVPTPSPKPTQNSKVKESGGDSPSPADARRAASATAAFIDTLTAARGRGQP